MMQRVRGADDINLPALMEQSLDTVDGANWVGSGKNDSHPQIGKRVVNEKIGCSEKFFTKICATLC